MKKETMKKLSVLGLVLMAASAVTAAIMPKSNMKLTHNGSIKVNAADTSDDATCVLGAANECTAGDSAGATTNGSPGASSNNGIGQDTIGNTSWTAASRPDSVLQ